MSPNTQRLLSRALSVSMALTLVACVSAEEKERRATAAMVEQAKADLAAESTFVQDSLKLAASITVDTIDLLHPLERGATDRDGNTWRDTVYQVITRDSATCLVDSLKFSTLRQGDTLSCQWEKRK